MSDDSAPEAGALHDDQPNLEAGRSVDHPGESDLYPTVVMPGWVAPAIGFALVLLSALAVWLAR